MTSLALLFDKSETFRYFSITLKEGSDEIIGLFEQRQRHSS